MQTAQLQKTKGLSTLRHPLPPPFPTFQRLHTFLETLPHTTLELEVSPGEYISVLTWALYLCVSVCTACLSVGKVFFFLFFNQKKQLLLKRVCLKVPFYSTGWSAADLILLSPFSWKFGSAATYRPPPNFFSVTFAPFVISKPLPLKTFIVNTHNKTIQVPIIMQLTINACSLHHCAQTALSTRCFSISTCNELQTKRCFISAPPFHDSETG